MVTISLDVHADERNEMSRAKEIISALQADEELEIFLNDGAPKIEIASICTFTSKQQVKKG